MSNSCGFLEVGLLLWWEDGSVIYSYNCFWAFPEQSLSGPSSAELATIFYCLIWDSSNLEGQVPLPIFPRNKVAQLYVRGTGFLGLERGPLSLVSTIEELLRRKSTGSSLETREYGSRDPSRWPRGILYQQKLALPSPTSGGPSVGIVRSRPKVTELLL
jgi:hypothetical protein